MSGRRALNEMARTDRVVPGLWRLRLPLPWPAVPHVNAFAVTAGTGIVLFDTGMARDNGLAQLRLALAQVGFELEDVRLLVCTHAHIDHYGLAAPILDAAGCELWMHPAWGHVRELAEDPAGALEHRLEVARQSGVPAAALEEYRRSRADEEPGIVRAVPPDRELTGGVEVETDLGIWTTYETPGHAPSHVVLHQPERRLLISGDHLLGRVSLYFDHGHTPDPVAEFLGSLDTVERLDVGLCLAGHGRPFRELRRKIAANRAEVDAHLSRVRAALSGGPSTAFETVPELIGSDDPTPAAATWGLSLALAYLDHLAALGEVTEVEGSDPRRWRIGE